MHSFLGFVIVVSFIGWILTLIIHLRRSDLSDTDRIVWTVVLCTLNIPGMILYCIMAPDGDSKAKTEEELKAYFNSRSDKQTAMRGGEPAGGAIVASRTPDR